MRWAVLLVDDSEDDRLLVERAFHEHRQVDCLPTSNTQAAERALIEFSRRPGGISWALLDYRLKGGGSLEFVRRIRQQELFRRLPIIMFSGGMSPTELNEAYEAGVSSCVTKPNNYEELRELIGVLVAYWCGTVELPTKHH